MGASDKLFYWLFQNHPDRILELQRDLPAEAHGWRFSAPVIKEREHRLDWLFQPPAGQPHLPAVLLEAQMASDPKFLRRLYAQSARLVEQEQEIEHWRVVVICPHRRLNFGRSTAVAEFVRERVHWVELEPAAKDPAAPPLLRALALLVQPEEELPGSRAAPGRGGRHRPGGGDCRCDRRYRGETIQWPVDPGAVRHGRHHPGVVHAERGLQGDLWSGAA